MAYKKGTRRQFTLVPTIQRSKDYLRVIVNKPDGRYAGATFSFRTGQMTGDTDYFPQLERAMTSKDRERLFKEGIWKRGI